MDGRKFLRVTGILMIIGGALSILFGFIALFGSLIGNVLGVGGLLVAAAILALIGGAVELVAGIFGVLYAERSDKARTCIVMGIIVTALSVVSNVINFSVQSLVLGLVLPVLYLIGAFKNKQAAGG
ncbi:MAG: hypothetical protein LBK75_07785 [Oscillospiraceae bacterium]|jgi:hypothetical protein|nr:hypothetical protein [Oscillospiraceae bacterium]